MSPEITVSKACTYSSWSFWSGQLPSLEHWAFFWLEFLSLCLVWSQEQLSPVCYEESKEKSLLRRNPLGNWVILIFSRQKPCTRIISILLIVFFFTLFKGFKCNKLNKIILKKRFLLEPEKTNFKSLKFHKVKSYAWQCYLRFLSSCEFKRWNIFSWAPVRNCLWCYYR